MTVAELIVELQQYDQSLQVVCPTCSEYAVLEHGELSIETLCEPRPDGWVQLYRPDKPTQQYLAFPG